MNDIDHGGLAFGWPEIEIFWPVPVAHRHRALDLVAGEIAQFADRAGPFQPIPSTLPEDSGNLCLKHSFGISRLVFSLMRGFNPGS